MSLTQRLGKKGLFPKLSDIKMSGPGLYRLLERPWIYGLSQRLIAFGGEPITPLVQQMLAQMPPARRVLDIGCGPSSYLWRAGLDPIGLDLSFDYVKSFNRQGRFAVTGSAIELPFGDNTIDGVWSIGLLHHLTDDMVQLAVNQMVKVCRVGGYIVIFDGVLPEYPWKHPLAHVLRKKDRGRFMRTQSDLEYFLLPREDWVCKRIQYSPLGLEGLFCTLLKK